jgi:hypothetical protein
MTPLMQAQETIAAIGRTLEGHAVVYERARDPRCVFARAYATLSHELAASMPSAGFSDPTWVAQLATVFSDYYLRALREHEAGTLAPGAWATVFDASQGHRTSVIEDLVLGMTAHIVNDLPYALCDVGLETATGQSRIGDYHMLNEVLGHAVDKIQKAVTLRYDPLLGLLDHLLESYDEIITNYGVRISRATAWYNALRLLDPGSRAATTAAIADSPSVTLHEILDPPNLSLRILFRGARLVSRSARRWPQTSSQLS